jgi:ATP-dependent DNA helicase RecG
MSAPAAPSRSLETDAQYLKGVGPRLAATLAKAGLKTVGDVLYHFPRRYEDRRNIPPISSMRPGQWATVRGHITAIDGRPSRGGMVILKVTVSDRTGSVTLTWFNQPWIKRKLTGYEGEILAYGQVKEANWGYEINSPEFELLNEDDEAEDFAKIVPVYPLVEGVSQKMVRKAAASAITHYLDRVPDPLPPGLLRMHDLKPLRWALSQIHSPTSEENRIAARKRLVFDEFFFMQVALAMKRAETQAEVGIAFPLSDVRLASRSGGKEGDLRGRAALWQEIGNMLPFELTGAQKRVVQEVWADMERGYPMNRLVQGDVGSGKTAVAACSMLAAVRCGYQCAMMAPTEILAEQHYANLHRLFEPLGIEVVLLVGKQTPTQKKKAAARAASGEAGIAVGTHALIQEGVSFQKLGLVIVDEQHRFGVMQRAALREKGLGNPDVLVMTATPIPRTLTMTLYGDLDLSIIDELPPGRRAIKTHWKQPYEREGVYGGVKKLVQEGRQAYFVCPMVSESEKMLAQAAEELHFRLKTKVYPDLRVGLLHGQMKATEKEEVMEQFRRHDLDILVSTTVIEVGVDVANASVMVVEDANRFGLSQLHQLRGRVGRGEYQSYCILISDTKTEDAAARMEIMVATTDGFRIAEEDLRLRGPGEIAGTKQSGNLDLKLADLVQDGRMLEVAREAAIKLITADPHLARSEHQAIREKAEQWGGRSAMVAIS